ncbi:hypothetical protein Tsubulata_037731 [Turnera subulata]|uniref:Uncharacterized protein n=1 Tax=Turnera subulata TaxID=218843 RepID=A0A9Q0GE50_9ROSI|nr:hypothetical protein Tsubulata_037731 [Turnera subulata]
MLLFVIFLVKALAYFCNATLPFNNAKQTNFMLSNNNSVIYPSKACCPSILYCFSAQKLLSSTHGRGLEKLKKRRQCGQVFSLSRTDYSGDLHGDKQEEDVKRATLIWRAVKLPIYSVALVPLTVGSSAAYWHTGVFLAKRYLLLLVSSVLIITWLNLSNDVYDSDTGADKNKKESVVNLVGSRSGTIVVASLSLALGSVGLAWTSVEAGTIRAILLLACSILCGYIYQVEDDRAVGKMSPLVRLGTERGSKVVTVAVMTLYSSLMGFGLSKALPFTCILLCALTLPMAKLVIDFVQENHKDKGRIFMAKYYCVRLHALFGAALSGGLVAARLLAISFIPKFIVS